MATIINSVAFENFYNYYGSYKHNEYLFEAGINIVNADNNMGKSKFYNGFMWILRDQVYDSDIKGFADANESLIRMASGKAKMEDGNFKVGIKVVFTNDSVVYTIEKYANFSTINGVLSHTPSLLSVIKTCDNADTPILDKDEQNDILNRVFIPLALRNYALLQGESMDRLVDLSSKQALSDTIDTLAGIAILKGICEKANKMAKKADDLFQIKDSENSANDSSKQKDKNLRRRYMDDIEKAKISLENAKDELNVATRRKEELEAYISNSNKRIEIRSQLDSVNREIQQAQRLVEDLEKSITKRIFNEDCPWLLMGLGDELEAYDKKREKYIGDLAQLNNDGALVIMLPEGSPDTSSLERMLNNEICEVCGQPAIKHSEAWNHIKMILDRPKKVSTTRNDFSTFYGSLQKSSSSYSRSITRIMDNIEGLRTKIDTTKDSLEELESKRDDIFTQLNNAGGNADNSDFNDREVIADYNEASNNIGRKDREIHSLTENIDLLERQLKKINDKLALYKKNTSTEKYEKFAELMQAIKEVINQSKDDIFDRTIVALAKEANDKYALLTQGNQSSGGQLKFERNHDVVNVSIRDIQNGEITGLGTGFQRMKQLSIVMAVISSKIGNEKKFDYPFISDAPFSEFGENFINNFFKVAPGVFSQSIIMIKELYDPKSKDLLTPFGRRILEEMKTGKIPGTFYVNVIEERADTTGLVTSHQRYV